MSATLLLIDDNPLNLKLARDVLELGGYTVVTAGDAEEALQLLSEPLPDLILLDLALPGMDGLSFCRLIKADARWSHIPVVALTAYAMKGDDRKALDAGCAAYITKPIDTRRLAHQVGQVLAGASRQAESRVRILVVEDDRIDLRLMGEVLEINGHMVLANTSAEAAAHTVQHKHPDVILLDLQLPGMDGLAFVRQLKSQPDTRNIPIVAITAFHDRYRRDELLAAGCAAYLVKPVDTRELARQLETAARLTAAPSAPGGSAAAPGSP
jgi:two-component system, cell cycle response regulator